jgi:hypothetical protein
MSPNFSYKSNLTSKGSFLESTGGQNQSISINSTYCLMHSETANYGYINGNSYSENSSKMMHLFADLYCILGIK